MPKWSQWIFWILVGVFFLFIVQISGLPMLVQLGGRFFFLFLLIASSVLLLSLGITLLVLTKKGKTEGLFRKFQFLTGASALGIPASIILHNAIYGLLIHFFDWSGGDEPFFFFLAVIVCPLGFLVGAIGSIVLVVKSRLKGVIGK